MTSPLSLRLPSDLEQKVRWLAAIEQRSLADMVRVLAEEAIKTREFPDVTFIDGPTGRRATFRDGVELWEILEPYIVAGKDFDILRQSYPDIGEGRLHDAVRYYEKYPAEIDARVELNADA